MHGLIMIACFDIRWLITLPYRNRVDDDLYNRYLRSAPVQNLCYVCRNFGHYANACPVRLSAPFGLKDVATSRSVPPFLAPVDLPLLFSTHLQICCYGY